MNTIAVERERLIIQSQLDSEKTSKERNELGQFATPTALSNEIVEYGLSLLAKNTEIRFLDPAIGSGSFFSALLNTIPEGQVACAKGFEIDPHYAKPAKEFWKKTNLKIDIADFTKASAPSAEEMRYDLIICNPPYVRHHHLAFDEKIRLQKDFFKSCGVRISGLAGLYCYFMGLTHSWMKKSGISAWLIPSEFMDVNYGQAVKQYLLERVKLLKIHRFDPKNVQFQDALVSSCIVWIKNEIPTKDHTVEFSFGGSLRNPVHVRTVPASLLMKESKWTRFPIAQVSERIKTPKLSDYFRITRGIATGDNKYFILSKEQILNLDLPFQVFKPILPSPRYLPNNEVYGDDDGFPLTGKKLFVLDCRIPESQVKSKYPNLWKYLATGIGTVSEGYLCRSRRLWYSQEEREPAPIVCTYLGRSENKSGRPFRFILNRSKAIATNVYLLLYPREFLSEVIKNDPTILNLIWEMLNKISPESLLSEGRVYGGGLHKLEPKELAMVDATIISEYLLNTKNDYFEEQMLLLEETPSYTV